jgi:5'-nucleotidase (lipoprotein e(P4) family)
MTTQNLKYRVAIFSSIILLLCTGMDGRVGTKEQATPIYEHASLAMVWFQTSAECRALYYQAFNTARLELDQHLRTHRHSMTPAIVFDIDDTILDDSPHSVMLLKQNKLFPFMYDEWLEAAMEEALPGALEFARHAHSRGVDLYYVSNRTSEHLMATIRNLEKAGFPQAEESHVLLMGQDPSKEGRRKAIASDHEIVMLLGDNLNDLSDAFEHKSVADRAAETDKSKDRFGSKYIVLPNPVYGAWESAVYHYKSNLTESEKDSLRKSALKSF